MFSKLSIAVFNVAVLTLSWFIGIQGLDNGLGLTPPMGFSSWNAVAADVSSAFIKNITKILIDSGLAAKGYDQVNVDEGWIIGRDPFAGIPIHDNKKFPEGMDGLAAWVHSQETFQGSGKFMKFGLYTSRGTCQCSEADYSGPGSYGYMEGDLNWMAKTVKIDYLKIDSCCGQPQPDNHQAAFNDYGMIRDILNKTGRSVYISVCGWYDWYAPPDESLGYEGGYSIGNQWRIAGDGDTWPALTNCFNTANRLHKYAGPGGWNDPDLLVGPNTVADGSYLSEAQARTQVNLWSVIAAPLLISNDLTKASEYNIETYGNEEVIAVDQDPKGIPGFRIVGDDLTYPCTVNDTLHQTCTNVWGRELNDGSWAFVFLNNGPAPANIICDDNCFRSSIARNGISGSFLIIRDLWLKTTVAVLDASGPFTFNTTVPGLGDSKIFKVTITQDQTQPMI